MGRSNLSKRKSALVAIVLLITMLGICGCSLAGNQDKTGEDVKGENIIITETGEVLEKEVSETAEPVVEETPAPEIITLTEPIEEPEQEQMITEHDEVSEKDPDALQIVFLGDSILDNYRTGTGIAYLTGKACNANVYNLAIGGTSASLESHESQDYNKWTSRSLVGIVLMLAGRVSTDSIAGTRSKEVMEELDVSNTDYFVIEYGLNDFFRGVPMSSESRKQYDVYTYGGALDLAVVILRELVPDATIILCCPNYAQFFGKDNIFLGDGNTLNTGHGTLFDYKGACEYVANSRDTKFLNAYQDLGINGYTADEYLEDGVHLSTAGRKIYADYLSKMIMNYEETKNN